MTAVRHGLVAKRLLVRCKVTGKDVVSGQIADERSPNDKLMVKGSPIHSLGSNIANIGNENEVTQEEKRVRDKKS